MNLPRFMVKPFGAGFGKLITELGAMLKPIRDFLTLWIPHTQPQTIARLHALAQIVKQDYSGEQAYFRARIPPHVRHEFERFVREEVVPG